MQENKINFNQERDFGEVINVTILFIKQNIKALGKAVLYFIAPLGLIAGIFYGLYQYYTLGQAFDFAGNLSMGVIVAIVMVILFVVVFTLLQAIVLEMFNEYREKGPGKIDIHSLWSRAKDSFGTILGTSIILGFLMGGVILVMVLFSLITPYLLIAFVIPFFYAILTIYFVYPVRVYEKADIGEAITRSFTLIKGNWWWTFLLYFIVSMAAGLLSSIFMIPQYIYTFATAFTAASGESASMSMTMAIITGILSMVGQVVVNTIPFIALIFHYYNLLEKKDKPGLQKRLDQLLPTQANHEE